VSYPRVLDTICEYRKLVIDWRIVCFGSYRSSALRCMDNSIYLTKSDNSRLRATYIPSLIPEVLRDLVWLERTNNRNDDRLYRFVIMYPLCGKVLTRPVTANPVGGALGQLISPIAGDTNQSILILGIICTAIAPCVFLVQSAPPTPPSEQWHRGTHFRILIHVVIAYAASQKSPSLLSLLRLLTGEKMGERTLSVRERFDFVIISLVFGVFVASYVRPRNEWEVPC
jgi:type IV secretory pathway VirB2 component (pilin)